MENNNNKLPAEFTGFDLDTFVITAHGSKRQKPPLSATLKKYHAFCRRRAFATYVASKTDGCCKESNHMPAWCCCGQTFREPSSIHKHVAKSHESEIQQLAEYTFEHLLRQLDEEAAKHHQPSVQQAESVDIAQWIPDTSSITEDQLQKGPGKVLLYYCYCQVEDPHVISAWQKDLCEKLHLTGKVRVATEGINGTVGGSEVAADMYIKAMRSHPLFKIMEEEDFKISDGGAECFTDLRVGVYKEIVPMGVSPDVISYKLAGIHLQPEEFHKEVEALLSNGDLCNDTILLDCRNFYESKIGQFSHCLAPNIRKFSYFPDYVDQNLKLFKDKKVLMYCTGGIRCERASAYLRSKDVCKEVYQLKGGIHKYLEHFPEGYYRGKLFVFDERYAISSNSDVISECRYCGSPWDQYQLCTTQLCCQLVLSCPACRLDGRTACCLTCQNKRGLAQSDEPSSAPQPKEECECTDGRLRVPQEVM